MARRKNNQTSADDKAAGAADNSAVLALAGDLVSAYMGHNQLPANEIPSLIRSVFTSLSTLSGATGNGNAEGLTPAVTLKKSVSDDFIICLEDGKKLRTLKRYLNTHFGLSPEQYRAKWHLPFDYPMVAPSYARLRSEFAKKTGLGRTPVSGARRRGRAA